MPIIEIHMLDVSAMINRDRESERKKRHGVFHFMSASNRSFFLTMTKWGVICVLVGFIVAIGIPNFVAALLSTSSNACINNLRQIQGAKEQWGLENKKLSTDIPTRSEIAAYLGADKLPACPLGGTYIIGRLNEDRKCSISTSAWPNDHVLNITNSWWNNFKSAYSTLLSQRSQSSSK